MPAGTREIKGRMKAVGNIQRITKTMQLIASARFQKMQRRATDAQAYTRKIGEVVRELSAALGDSEVTHPLLNPPDKPAGKELLLILTSNRGLCGAFNANVLRTANGLIRAHGADRYDVEVVGKKGVGFCKFNDIPMSAVHNEFGDEPAFTDVHALAERYMAEFIAGKYDAVKVVYMSFKSMSRQAPMVGQLLPMSDPTGGPSGGKPTGPTAQYEFSPEPQELLGEILPVTVKTTLFQWFNEAVVSEQIARMVAMKAATDAAGKLGKTLKRKFNRARQTAITTELSEIISGAAALE